MAEQVSHDVVKQTESTRGSAPLVDVVENLNTISAAGNGTQINANQESAAASAKSGHFAVKTAVEDASSVREDGRISAKKTEAEPSAGDALVIPISEGLHRATVDGQPGSPAAIAPDTARALDASPLDANVSQAGLVEQIKAGSYHNRTNSTKKPATFSKVSVTKNFMARSATSTLSAAKAGDKTAAAATLSPASLKPRLVAKTASNLVNSTRARVGTENAAGPDASKVWNKNRPAPAMPSKQFTDEELKQQYGIHLATRLQTDETSKGSKWADIDDDEDDWAPEAVVWMDGTKSTLAPSDLPIPVEEKVAAPVVEKSIDAPKPSLLVMKKPTESHGPPKTILKPGAAAQAKQQNGAALLTGSSGDKQTLKAKAPAPTPAKSPWATLPPVEKVSPINPPVQSQVPTHQTYASQDARFSDMPVQMAPPPGPAREIAADTFDRAWRGGEGERRELFNSTSGKYEPAPEGRRSSIRPESYGRKPSLLQRTQDHLNGGDMNSWPQRRGSSVSQNSGPNRRMSFARDSESAISDQHSIETSGQDLRSAQATPSFSQQTPWSQQLPPPPSALQDTTRGEETEDVIKAQARIMREGREAARRRRLQEEEREEAARKERLQAKLDALSGAGQSRKERQAAVDSNEPVSAAVVDHDSSGKTPSAKHGAQSAAKTTAAVDRSKPVQAVDAATANPAGTSTRLAEAVVDATLPPSKTVEAAPTSLKALATDSSPRLQLLSPSTASRTTLQSQANSDIRTAQTSAFTSPATRDRKPQPFARSPIPNQESYSPWPSTGSSGSVWGTSGIGNGTFESSSSLFAPLQKSFAAPPGMSRQPNAPRITSQPIGQTGQPTGTSSSIIDQNSSLPSNMDVRADHLASQPLNDSVAAAPGISRQQHVPGPIGPPSRVQQANMQTAQQQVNTWHSTANRLANQYNIDSLSRSDRPRPEGSQAYQAKRNDTFRETFRQISKDQVPLGAPRKFDQSEFSIHESQGLQSEANPMPPNTQTQPAISPLHSWKHTGNAVRLPGNIPDLDATTYQQPQTGRTNITSSQTANYVTAPLAPAPDKGDKLLLPPSETSSHPVYEGGVNRPNVRLPPAAPVVKLPPSANSLASMPNRALQQNLGYGGQRPLVMNEAWQARFNGLFNRTPIQTEIPPSPPRTPPKPQAPVLAVASSSRIYVDDGKLPYGATVSLPKTPIQSNRSPEGFLLDDSSDVASKTGVQQMFYDDLGFGSRPVVHIPTRSYDPKHSNHAKVNLLTFPLSSKDKSSNVYSQTRADLPTHILFYKKPDGVFVKMTGSSKSKLVFHHRKTQRTASGKSQGSKVVSSKREAVPSPSPKVSKSSPASRKPSSAKVAAAEKTHSASNSTPSRKKSGLHKSAKVASTAQKST